VSWSIVGHKGVAMMTFWNRLTRLFVRKPVSFSEAKEGREAQEAVERARAAAQHQFQDRTVRNSGWFM
jgi:hypothetical protein|tara:strand:- start:250 stop:453 length:204 start_codon:yes stop_codon:yes gene_type:complete